MAILLVVVVMMTIMIFQHPSRVQDAKKRSYCLIDVNNDDGGVDGDEDNDSDTVWYSMIWYDAIPYGSIRYQMMVIIHKVQKIITRPIGEFVPI